MKEKMVFCLIVLFLCSAGLFACSNNTEAEAESEKGAIEKMTDKTAKEVVNRIRTPINKARSVRVRQEGRMDDMEESLKEK
jgi:hypothetical protein